MNFRTATIDFSVRAGRHSIKMLERPSSLYEADTHHILHLQRLKMKMKDGESEIESE